MPNVQLGSERRWRFLAGSMSLLTILALSAPVAVLASISSYSIGAQTPSPVTAGNDSTYSISVVAGQSNHRVSVTAVAGLPAGATFEATCGLGSSNAGQRVPITLTIHTNASTTPAGTSTITPTVHMYQSTSTCSGTLNDSSTAHTAQLVVVAATMDQTITFGSLADKTYGDADFDVSATASSGLPVSFSSNTTSVCTVAGSTVSIVAAGDCTIQADQAGNSTYNPAPSVTQTFTVAKADQALDFPSLSDKTFGDPDFDVTATASSGLPVTFSATTEDVCTVSGSTVHLVSAGDCTIDADQVGDTNYNAAPTVSQTFTVTTSNQTITFDPLADMTYGDPDFDVSATASSGLPVSFSSETTDVCTVSGSTVHIVGGGDCTIDADQAGDTSYDPAPTVPQTFAVAKADATIDVADFNGPFDGSAHGVTGTATGVFDEDLSSLLDLGSTFVWVPGGTVDWAFAGNDDYNSASGTATVVITISNVYPFTDIEGSTFKNDIIWLYQSGYTSGCAPTLFCPDGPLTRGQMAAFLVRVLDLPATSTDYFTDDNGTTFENDINRLAAAGITKGCGPTTYCPDGFVLRDQMASFLARAFSLPSTTTDFFTDDNGNTHEQMINRIAAAGITKGCTPTTYCPSAQVTRGQIAAFIHRANY